MDCPSVCKSLERAPIVPNDEQTYADMCRDCSDEIIAAYNWNLEHIGLSYNDIAETKSRRNMDVVQTDISVQREHGGLGE